MPTITTRDGTEIFYKDWGSGQPIVFSHGWPLSGDDWDTQMLFFLQHGYRVIAHDRRGHGRSTQTGDGHDMDHYADDLAAVTAHLDLKDAVHVGHSTGGGEVVRYLDARPRLADVDPVTLNATAETIEAQIRPETRAIMVVHFGGLMAEMGPIMELARSRGLPVVEDAGLLAQPVRVHLARGHKQMRMVVAVVAGAVRQVDRGGQRHAVFIDQPLPVLTHDSFAVGGVEFGG